MSCEYYIPNTEELDYVGTKDLKVQSLDLLWSLRLFVTGQGWRVARYLDPESAFPGYAALSKRIQPLVNQLKESERDDSLKDVYYATFIRPDSSVTERQSKHRPN